MPGLRALGTLYLERQTFHVNANILAASLTGTAATALASAYASGLGWSPNAVAAIGTASNALVFVPVQLALHYLVVRLQARRTGETDVRRRYWRETRRIWATGLPAIAVFLTLFTLGQSLILRLGLRPLATTALAYVAAQAMGRLVHTLLLRFTSPSPEDQSTEPKEISRTLSSLSSKIRPEEE